MYEAALKIEIMPFHDPTTTASSSCNDDEESFARMLALQQSRRTQKWSKDIPTKSDEIVKKVQEVILGQNNGGGVSVSFVQPTRHAQNPKYLKGFFEHILVTQEQTEMMMTLQGIPAQLDVGFVMEDFRFAHAHSSVDHHLFSLDPLWTTTKPNRMQPSMALKEDQLYREIIQTMVIRFQSGEVGDRRYRYLPLLKCSMPGDTGVLEEAAYHQFIALRDEILPIINSVFETSPRVLSITDDDQVDMLGKVYRSIHQRSGNTLSSFNPRVVEYIAPESFPTNHHQNLGTNHVIAPYFSIEQRFTRELCSVCLEPMFGVVGKLSICNHALHLCCLQEHYLQAASFCCPLCRSPFHRELGPSGSMKISLCDSRVCITSALVVSVKFHIPSGIQEVYHPDPFLAYQEARVALSLPYCKETMALVNRLEVAFVSGLLFRVVDSKATPSIPLASPAIGSNLSEYVSTHNVLLDGLGIPKVDETSTLSPDEQRNDHKGIFSAVQSPGVQAKRVVGVFVMGFLIVQAAKRVRT